MALLKGKSRGCSDCPEGRSTKGQCEHLRDLLKGQFSTLPGGFVTVAQTVKIMRLSSPRGRNFLTSHCHLAQCEGSHCPLAQCEGSHCPLAQREGSHCPLAQCEGSHCPLAQREGSHCPISTVWGLTRPRGSVDKLQTLSSYLWQL